ncbi:MAG: 6-carboxytetrahydropterin synthase, partial [Bacteroidales bacterium]|nr:6-carboxytetrahydropterin synthase [Bacteroidales bacterium]
MTKIFRFEMAHALPDYNGPCAHLHGHSYRLEVTLSTGAAEIPTEGMVMDFSQLKRMVEETIIAQVDHALVLDERMDAALIDALRKVNT